jgi:hypothetical protein
MHRLSKHRDRDHRRRAGRPAVRSGLASSVFLALLVSTSVAHADPGRLRIQAPRMNQLIPVQRLPVEARVKVPAGAHAVRAELRRVGRKAVDLRLRPTGRGIDTVRLTRQDLVVGRDHLFLTARRSGQDLAASAHFTIGRERRGALEIHGLSKHERSDVQVRVKLGKVTDFRATLNGRRVTSEFSRGRRSKVASLAADDGLRFGRNRLSITAFDRYGGDYRTIRRSFFIGRGAPLIGAGPDRVVDSGARIRLDGSSSRAGRGTLALRWQIARRPAGSKARLRGDRGAKPVLVGAKPGEYRIKLHADQVEPVPAGAAVASASEVAPSTSDTTKICVQPDVRPTGVPIETIVSSGNPEVKVGSSSYPMQNPGESFLQVVVLDRCSLELISNTSYPANIVGLAEFEQAARSLGSEDLVILSGGAQSYGGPTQDWRFESILREEFGVVTGFGIGQISGLVHGDFSAISVPGTPPGAATQLIGGSRAQGVPEGDISGFLRVNSGGEDFTFNEAPTFLRFDTMAPGSDATTNTISIDGTEYTERISSNSYLPGGFHLLWLDAASLQLRGQHSYELEGEGLEALAAQLAQIEAEESGSLVFLSSYGDPDFAQNSKFNCCQYNTDQAGEVAFDLESLGANPYSFLGLDGTGGYSFVGATGLQELVGSDAGLELSQTEAESPTARITGLLEQNAQGEWLPGTDGSPAGAEAGPLGQTELSKLMAEPEESFEPLESNPKMPVQQYIYEQLDLGGKGGAGLDPNYGIRRYYWEDGAGFNSAAFGRYQTELAAMKPCTLPHSCATHFAEVRGKLVKEFGEVAAVKEFFTDDGAQGTLAKIFKEAIEGTDGIGFDSIATAITGLYSQPSQPPQGPNISAIISDSLGIAGGVTGAIPDVGGAISAPFWVAQGVNNLVNDLNDTPGGVPAYDPVEFQGDVYEWGTHLEELANTGTSSLAAVADLFVSDPKRLTEMSELLRTSPTDGGFDFSTGEVSEMTTLIERSEAKYLWSTMLPVPVSGFVGQCTVPAYQPFHGTLVNVSSPLGGEPGESRRVLTYGEELFPAAITSGQPTPISESTANILFGKVPGQSGNLTVSSPLGFKLPFLLSPSVHTTSVAANPGFPYLDQVASNLCA